MVTVSDVHNSERCDGYMSCMDIDQLKNEGLANQHIKKIMPKVKETQPSPARMLQHVASPKPQHIQRQCVQTTMSLPFASTEGCLPGPPKVGLAVVPARGSGGPSSLLMSLLFAEAAAQADPAAPPPAAAAPPRRRCW
eukprot:CAMPEP_0178639110 /NCGR_PEP_ID=MMETSP0698-20121128/15280_1 /TAXON_ID=265572 /ORGANISM="Extubocellulus spinifer, Strain CCMP396" /LENGTH=137 /DNA_ID=CAMNT_0020279405 /DNA_START=362 /DNA_END=776 /DNA_ORIENTATION=+